MPTSIPAQALFRRAPTALLTARRRGRGPGSGPAGAWLSTLRRSTFSFWAQKLAADKDAAGLEGLVVEFGRGIGTWGDEEDQRAEMKALDEAVASLLIILGTQLEGSLDLALVRVGLTRLQAKAGRCTGHQAAAPQQGDATRLQ
jgi:hypothetical protein